MQKHFVATVITVAGVALAGLSGVGTAAADPGHGRGNCDAPFCADGPGRGHGGFDRGDRGDDDRGYDGLRWDQRGFDQGRYDHQPFNYHGYRAVPYFDVARAVWGFLDYLGNFIYL